MKREIIKEQYHKPVIKVDTTKQIRCPFCNRMILKGVIKAIETKCPKCKQIIKFEQI